MPCGASWTDCKGSIDSHCRPHVVWGGPTTSTIPLTGHLGGGKLFLYENYGISYAFSVRSTVILHVFWSCFTISYKS